MLAEKCQGCRTRAASFYGQFATPGKPMQDYAELRAILAYAGLYQQKLWTNLLATESKDVPTVQVVLALGRTVLSLAERVRALEER